MHNKFAKLWTMDTHKSILISIEIVIYAECLKQGNYIAS